MPVMDGYDATESIRELEGFFKCPRTYVAALTSEGNKKAEKRCMSVGFDEFIVKPLKA